MADSADRDRKETVRFGDTDTLDTTSRGALRHLDDLDGWKLADGTPDIRGWSVTDGGGRKLGKVSDLLVDTGTKRVRYVEVKLEEEIAKEHARANDALAPGDEPLQHVLVPVGIARLDDDHDDVRLDAQASELIDLAYRRATNPAGHEAEMQRRFGTADAARSASGATRRPSDRELERQPVADFSVVQIEREAGIGNRDTTDPRTDDTRLGP